MAKKNKENDFKTVDKLSEELDAVDNFVLKNWKRYTYLAIGIIILIAAVLYFYETRATNNLREFQEFRTADSISEFKQVIKKYPDSIYTDNARLELAARYFENGKYEKAVQTYSREIKEGDDELKANIARVNRGHALAAKGDKNEALQKFKKIANNKNIQRFLRAEAAYSAGALLIDDDNKKQAEKYLKLCISFKDVKGWGKFAKGLLDNL
ncbi:MAG: tetratricopeptide repeat protein [Victivallales bacterium]|nr:tetratricopeptide repeat protein [Victivallales bacterium]MCF7888797.1 tetratricopeptide repeat protein [Victivallales bacterium]